MSRRSDLVEVVLPNCDRETEPYTVSAPTETSLETPEEAGELLQRVTEGALPLLVLRGCGVYDPEKAARFYEPIFKKAGFELNADRVQNFMSTIINGKPPVDSMPGGDAPFHMDADPTPPDEFGNYAAQPATAITVHATSGPENTPLCRAQFFPVTDEYMRAFGQLNYELADSGKIAASPRHIREDFSQGLIDPCYIKPEGWSVDLSRGDYVFFKNAGLNPLQHYFETLAVPRIVDFQTYEPRNTGEV
ncbi:MAG TPA: hypothetical protein VLG16_02225 [Candidatus Saccharimonadales bacterium]|nr:hypothetical protein [Candidatus Saccharimonadales bacterium]